MLESAIAAAKEAVSLQQAGNYAGAVVKYAEAADWLLIVMKNESDPSRREGLRKRIENYLDTAEHLKKTPPPRPKSKPKPKPPKPPTTPTTPPPEARAKTSTAESYFSADDRFRADVEKARALVKNQQTPFEDTVAIGDSQFVARRKVTRWLRPGELGWQTQVFPEPPSPGDVDQGGLGDCWLLSSLCVLAGFPELVRRLLVAWGNGLYVARLCYAGEWRLVNVDDRLPCRSDGSLAFAQPAPNGAFWVCIIEKALAKLFGSYAALENGTASEALGVLTGLPTSEISELHRLHAKRKDGIGSLDELFAELAKAHGSGYIVSASCGHTDKDPADYEKYGLRHAHEYAVLNIVQVDAVRLVQLRNPWAHGVWRGHWGPNSDKWKSKAGTDILTAFPRQDDGVFWMSLEDVTVFFHEVTVCRLRRNFVQFRSRVQVRPLLHSATTCFFVQGALHLDACILQATERGKLPKGHHVMADLSLLVFRARDRNDPTTWQLVTVTRRGALTPIVAAQCDLDEQHTYVVLPLCFNWRVLKLAGTLTAVFYSAKKLQIEPADLAPRQAANALRLAIKAEGDLMSKGHDQDGAQIWDFDGCYMVENRRPNKGGALIVTLGLGQSENCVSSRHGGVLDNAKPSGSYDVKDVVPPRSFMLTLFRVPYRPSWKVQAGSLKWLFTHRLAPSYQMHAPPLDKLLPPPPNTPNPVATEVETLHSVFPVPKDDPPVVPATTSTS